MRKNSQNLASEAAILAKSATDDKKYYKFYAKSLICLVFKFRVSKREAIFKNGDLRKWEEKKINYRCVTWGFCSLFWSPAGFFCFNRAWFSKFLFFRGFMKTEICSKCNSTAIVPNVEVRDYDATSHRELSLAVELPRPSAGAFIYKSSASSELRAWMCGNCGFTEFFAVKPAEVLSAYRQQNQL